MTQQATVRRLLRRIHENEEGAVSIETILILGAIAIPILIFILKFGWPKIKDYFNQGMSDLEAERSDVMNNN